MSIIMSLIVRLTFSKNGEMVKIEAETSTDTKRSRSRSKTKRSHISISTVETDITKIKERRSGSRRDSGDDSGKENSLAKMEKTMSLWIWPKNKRKLS